VTDWRDIRVIDLEPGDVILSRYGPAEVRGWPRSTRPGRVTVDAKMLDTGLLHVFHYAESGRAVRRARESEQPESDAADVACVRTPPARDPMANCGAFATCKSHLPHVDRPGGSRRECGRWSHVSRPEGGSGQDDFHDSGSYTSGVTSSSGPVATLARCASPATNMYISSPVM
jgi:hypothetical protein